ncbi:MAG: MotA/TolQ/ExbB proton channel family protein [Rhabdochlamydiaceae bacterium]|nr:MotA/TolQ/ExbB proton channel family protein [Rhabdochlamydiaceae bacterium]
MKPYQILMTSACLFTLSLAHADPLEFDEPSSLYTSEYDESLESDLSMEDEQETDPFEEEILALEEELKHDAESFEDTLSAEEEEIESSDPFAASSNDPDLSSPDEEIDPIVSEALFENDPMEEAVSLEPEATELVDEPNQEIAQESPEADSQDEAQFSSQNEAEQAEPLAVMEMNELDQAILAGEPSATLQIEETISNKPRTETIEVNLEQAFSGSPYIYTLLGLMSVTSVGIWLYSMISLRTHGNISPVFLKNIQNKLNSNQFEDALSLCSLHESVFSKMIASGIQSRRHGLPMMVEAMKAEGKRASVFFWQKLGLLNDIAIIAPMLGLLGTVMGMFYAFYDINRSIESISTLFDGLGVSVGTTVAGLIVAILALILHSTAKYRLVKTLAHVENEAQTFAAIIDDRTSVYKA